MSIEKERLSKIDPRSVNARLRSSSETVVKAIVDTEAAKSGKVNILILGHSNPNPDGDCCASTFGLFHFLHFILGTKRIDNDPIEAEINVAFNSSNVSYLNKVYNYNNYLEDSYTKKLAFDERQLKANLKDHLFITQEEYETKCSNKKHDVIIVLDTDFDRTLFGRDYFSAPELYINIDHHQPKEDSVPYGTLGINKVLEIIEPKASSTSELVLNIVSHHLWYLHRRQINFIFRLLKVGLHTDTGNFVFSNAPRALKAIANFADNYRNFTYPSALVEGNLTEMLAHNQSEFTKCVVYKHHPCDRKIIADILNNVQLFYAHNGNPLEDGLETDLPLLAVVHCKKSELSPRVKPIDVIRTLDNLMAAAAFTYDEETHNVKVELRSETNIINCVLLAKMIALESGGHIQASGGTVPNVFEWRTFSKYPLGERIFIEQTMKMINDNVRYGE